MERSQKTEQPPYRAGNATQAPGECPAPGHRRTEPDRLAHLAKRTGQRTFGTEGDESSRTPGRRRPRGRMLGGHGTAV